MKNFFNFIKNSHTRSMVKMIFILTFLLFLYTSLCAFSYAKSVSTDISDSVFRLHVLANSDSEEDQALKYKVRDNLINYMNSICTETTSKDEAISIANNHLDNFKKIAEDTISVNGYNYTVQVQVGNFEFPTKTYGDISLPAGNYDALRVNIGEAKGQNWWCVMFPPLCFIDVSSGVVPDNSKDVLKNSMNEEDFALVSESDESSEISFKFKILELFGKSGFMTAKKGI